MFVCVSYHEGGTNCTHEDRDGRLARDRTRFQHHLIQRLTHPSGDGNGDGDCDGNSDGGDDRA
jgi:hypothetical protein